jgi:hypothetical protein
MLGASGVAQKKGEQRASAPKHISPPSADWLILGQLVTDNALSHHGFSRSLAAGLWPETGQVAA